MGQPGFFFYCGDWLKDTRALDPYNRGLWIDTLCLLNEHGGEITWPVANLAQFLGIDIQSCHAFVTLLSRLGNANVTLDVTGDVTLVSRRMVRDEKKRESQRLRQEKARDRQGRHRNVTLLSQPSHTVLPSLNLNPSSNPKEDTLVNSARLTSFAEDWNSTFSDRLAVVRLPLSESRKRKLRLRLHEHPQEEFWDNVFTNIGQSKFLLGNGGDGWRCTFDFVIDNESNCLKIDEGQYAEGKKRNA